MRFGFDSRWVHQDEEIWVHIPANQMRSGCWSKSKTLHIIQVTQVRFLFGRVDRRSDGAVVSMPDLIWSSSNGGVMRWIENPQMSARYRPAPPGEMIDVVTRSRGHGSLTTQNTPATFSVSAHVEARIEVAGTLLDGHG